MLCLATRNVIFNFLSGLFFIVGTRGSVVIAKVLCVFQNHKKVEEHCARTSCMFIRLIYKSITGNIQRER